MANSAIVGTLRAVLSADTAEFASAMKKAGDTADQTAAAMIKASGGFKELEVRASAITRLMKDFSGSFETRQAKEWAVAIEAIGGAAKLSEGELRRASGVFTDYISKAQAMGQQVPAEIRKVSDEIEMLRGTTSKSVGIFDTLKGAFQNLGPTALSAATGFATALISVEALTKGLRAVFDFVKDSVSAYAEQEKAVRKLTAALEAQGTATPKTIKAYKDLADQFARTTTFSDELLIEMEGLLVQVGNVMPNEMEAALDAVTNLASGLQIDLRSATMMVSKAAEDNFTALQKQGVQIDVTKAKAEGFAYVLGQINAKFGGQAAADLATFDGQIKQLGKSFNELQEQIGEVIVKSPAFQAVFALLRFEIEKTGLELKLVIDSLKLMAAIPGPVGESLRFLVADFKNTATEAGKVQEAIQNFNRMKFGTGENLPKKYYEDYAAALADVRREVENLSPEVRKQIDAAKELGGDAMKQVQERFHLSNEVIALATKNTKEHKKVVDEAAKAYREWADAFSDAKLLEKVGQLQVNLAKLRKESTPSARELKAIAEQAQKLGDELGFLPTDLKTLANQFFGLNKGIVTTSASLPVFTDRLSLSGDEIRDAKAEVDALRKKFEDLNKLITGPFKLPKGGEVDLKTVVAPPDTRFLSVLKNQLGEAAAEFPDMLAKAIIHGEGLTEAFHAMAVNIGGAIGSEFGKGMAKAGTQASKILGSIFGALGGIAGDLIFKGVSAAWHKATRNVARDMQDQFATAELGFRNLAELNDKLRSMGAADLVNRGDRAQRKDDEDATRKWMDDVRKFLGDADKAAQALATRLAGAFDELSQAASEFGGKAPAALQPFIDELLKMNGLTEEQRGILQGLAGAPEWQQLQSIAEKYGIELGSLGQKFQEGRIGDTALQYARDFMTLRDAGGDVNGILNGMQDEVQGLVSDSLRFGVALPEALRDVVQGLINMGKLTDENGDALTDLTRINFKGTLEDAFIDIKSILEEIRDLLAKGIPGAARDAGKGIDDAFQGKDYKIPVHFDWGDANPPEGFSVPGGVSMQHGGITKPGGLTPAILHPNEAVIPLDQLGANEDRYVIYLDNYIDGRKVTESVLLHTREVARRIGVRPI